MAIRSLLLVYIIIFCITHLPTIFSRVNASSKILDINIILYTTRDMTVELYNMIIIDSWYSSSRIRLNRVMDVTG